MRDRRKPNIRELFVSDDWRVVDVDFNIKTGKYDFKAEHKNGILIEISRNCQYVDNLLDELQKQKDENK